MKTKLSLIFMLLSGAYLLSAGTPPVLKQNSNYVVIGAFASHENAVHFVEKAKKNQLDAQFEMNPNRKLFYVYVLHTDDRKLAFEQAQNLRSKSHFSDTWVFTGMLGESSSQTGVDVNPETGEKINKVETVKTETPSQPVQETVVATEQNVAPVSNEIKTTSTPTSLPIANEDKDGHTFFFKILKASSEKELTGEVDVIDQDKNKKSATYNGNQDVFVRSVNKSGNVVLKCQVFGYRNIEKGINFNDVAANEGIQVEGNKITVPFEMVRLKKGDIVVMYNVFFYKDAAIMRPESRSEVTSLLEMMKENTNMRVRIHGHTNGGAPGKIIEVGDSKNFFSLTGTKEGFGSAKKLSEERAQIINDFLVSEGIDQSRLEVKAWGGKKPIYDKEHSLAHSNVRVEIEIIND